MFKIFDTINFCLSPSYFYNSYPADIKISRHPGFLTSEGGLLFLPEASNEKYLDSVSMDAKIGDVAWDGQLFVPIWSFNYRRYATVMIFLVAWLYADLPQYITPTPGIAPSLLAHAVLDSIFPPTATEIEIAQTTPFKSVVWQWIFFLVHVVKIGFIYLIFHSGSFNPYSLNPFKRRTKRSAALDEQLLKSIGWTSACKGTIKNWRLENSRAKVKEVGVRYAHEHNLWYKLRTAGVYLDDDEGFGVKKNMTVAEQEKLEKTKIANPSKVYMSQEFLKLYFEPLIDVFDDESLEIPVLAEALAEFRKYGPKKGTPELKEIYDKREKLRNKLGKEKE